MSEDAPRTPPPRNNNNRTNTIDPPRLNRTMNVREYDDIYPINFPNLENSLLHQRRRLSFFQRINNVPNNQ